MTTDSELKYAFERAIERIHRCLTRERGRGGPMNDYSETWTAGLLAGYDMALAIVRTEFGRAVTD